MQRLGTLIQSLGGRSGGSTRPEEPWRQDQAVYFTEEILKVCNTFYYTMINHTHFSTYKELGPSTPLPQRLKVLRELHDIVSTKRLKQVCLIMSCIIMTSIL